jgi:hypothetical protein
VSSAVAAVVSTPRQLRVKAGLHGLCFQTVHFLTCVLCLCAVKELEEEMLRRPGYAVVRSKCTFRFLV